MSLLQGLVHCRVGNRSHFLLNDPLAPALQDVKELVHRVELRGNRDGNRGQNNRLSWGDGLGLWLGLPLQEGSDVALQSWQWRRGSCVGAGD